MSTIPEIHPKEVLEKTDYQLIDVRSEEEFVGELKHVPGSKLICLGPDLESWIKTQTPESQIIFICRSGNRSGKATLLAQEHGISNCFNMTGGMILWNELGLKTES